MNTDPSALDRLATYFNTSPIVVILWICAIAVILIAAIGLACIELAMSPEPEGRRVRETQPPARQRDRAAFIGEAWLLMVPFAIIGLWVVAGLVGWR